MPYVQPGTYQGSYPAAEDHSRTPEQSQEDSALYSSEPPQDAAQSLYNTVL